MWKRINLSLVGRLTLAKSVIETIHLYPMMTTKLPKSCVEDIHRLQRKFVWGDTDENRKLHAILWDTVTMPKQLGGMGFRDLNLLNRVCLMKLGWSMYNNASDLWC